MFSSSKGMAAWHEVQMCATCGKTRESGPSQHTAYCIHGIHYVHNVDTMGKGPIGLSLALGALGQQYKI